MVRLYIPEPKIKLYEHGFDDTDEDGRKHDQLNRKETSKKLSDLVERIDDPLVIALDGAWGSGKSVFLKCWVGEHLKHHGEKTQTVYFDAFEHDYLDDPLIALTSAISERIERDPESQSAKAWRMAKNAAPFLGKAALRLGTAALVGKAISLTGDEDGALNDIGDKFAEEGGDIAKSLNGFWKKEDGKRAAMDAFRKALIQLTEPNKDGEPTKKLVIVVDELDRCRPDYALSLLEIIKHFFSVDGVHFVLGVNLKELQNCVRARYGANSDSERYLQKFFHVQMPFTLKKRAPGSPSDVSNYFDHLCQIMQVNGSSEIEPLIEALKVAVLSTSHGEGLALRDVQRIATRAALSPKLKNSASNLEWCIAAGLVLLVTIRPSLVDKLKKGELEFLEADDVFSFSKVRPLSDFPDVSQQRLCWVWACGGNVDIKTLREHSLIEQAWNFDRLDLIPKLISTQLETLQVAFPN